MRRIVVTNNVSLDGVMQAPGRPDEDEREGFTRGGWAVPYADLIAGQVMAKGWRPTDALLLGRRTYEDFAGYWPQLEDNRSPASSTRSAYMSRPRRLRNRRTRSDGAPSPAVGRSGARWRAQLVDLRGRRTPANPQRDPAGRKQLQRRPVPCGR